MQVRTGRALAALVMTLAVAGAAEAQVFTSTCNSPRLLNELGWR